MIKVAIIGCGNIGMELACYLIRNKDFCLISLTDIDNEKIYSIRNKIKKKVRAAALEDAIEKADLIIEAANKEVVKEILQSKLLDKKNKKLLVMSSGGLIENIHLLKKINNCMIHVPSGAIAGLDAIKSVSGKINFLELTTTKPSMSLINANYVLKNKIDLKNLNKSKIIFQGNLDEAVSGFPQNINVAASLRLASEFDKMKITIIADPVTKYNSHEIICKGEFGEIKTLTKNLPSRNPKTSYLAILSAIATLKNMNSKIKAGN